MQCVRLQTGTTGVKKEEKNRNQAAVCAEPALPGWSCLGSSSSEEKPAEGREMPQEFTDKAEKMQ